MQLNSCASRHCFSPRAATHFHRYDDRQLERVIPNPHSLIEAHQEGMSQASDGRWHPNADLPPLKAMIYCTSHTHSPHAGASLPELIKWHTMSVNVSTFFNVIILVFIGFEIISSAFEAGKHVPTSIRLPATFLAAERPPVEVHEKTVTLSSLQPKIEVEQPEEDLSLTIAYSEYTNPHRPVSAGPANASETSYYLEWIRRDLQPWAKTGITAELVEAAAYNWSCMGERMRFNIVNGSLWVEHLSWRPKEGWYPAKLGPGNMSAKGKIPYIIFALLDTLRAYPGQVR